MEKKRTDNKRTGKNRKEKKRKEKKRKEKKGKEKKRKEKKRKEKKVINFIETKNVLHHHKESFLYEMSVCNAPVFLYYYRSFSL